MTKTMTYQVTETTYVGERQTYPKDAHGMVGKWNDRWVMGCPRCGNIVGLYDHDVTVDVEGLVTVKPSVGHTACKAHFYVRAGQIEELGDMA